MLLWKMSRGTLFGYLQKELKVRIKGQEIKIIEKIELQWEVADQHRK